MRVLVVEDDSDVRGVVVAALRSAGFAVDQSADWSQADLALSVNEYDCLVLDRMLPEGDSADQLHRRRQAGLTVPALMLTALDDVHDRVVGFESGADDYVAKPFSSAELVLRVRALCRRQGSMLPPVMRVGDIEVDVARREVRRAGILLTLTPKEFAVLETLLARHPSVVSRAELIEHCWDEVADPASNVVDVIIAQLRRKLGEPLAIATVRGAGYGLRHPSM
ncbi:transcriptional regulatory protein CutR [Longispora fulva]|uniref:DNA-binding response OmpR family regulator n=1 Tax=Longispora fulva TaxID=619741 RepID=A0A8J7KIZ9_9ACTN|nr:response regulator transcription factor [Longispora fulva]MBG6134961.1 DNA-binding response OmpR family regulator [Longispora fulva]GIG56807.1 transcriptional regulatory protein CutR [Longispora fulva]